MTHKDEWTDRLSDHLNGDLEPEARAAVEAHLAECGACREVLEELRAVVARLRGLGELQPERDLWPGVAVAIGAPETRARPEADEGVIALPTAADAGETVSGIFLTAPQLAAAAVALILVSASATLWAWGGTAAGPDRTLPGAAAEIFAASGERAPEPPEGLAEELRSLEAALARSSVELDPNTIRIISRNLGVIERAIEESRQALAQDPGNPFLEQHLDRAYRQKLTYLREATQLVGQSG